MQPDWLTARYQRWAYAALVWLIFSLRFLARAPTFSKFSVCDIPALLGLAFGGVLGVTYGVIRGLSGDRIATVTRPNQGIRQSAKNALLFAIVATIAPLLTAHLLGNTYPAFWAASGLSFGLALGGGEALINHGILRLMLACQSRVPWNYACFLDYAAERIFLQKVGGGYIFVHRLLLEHFAKGTPEGRSPEASSLANL